MSTTKEPPSPFPAPPVPPPEPFLLLRRPPEPAPASTLVGLGAPRAAGAQLPPLPPARAAASAEARPLRRRLVLAREGELEQAIEGLRVELAYSREWFRAEGLVRRRRRPVAALTLGIALGLGLGLAGGWSWPAVAWIAHLGAPPAPSAQR